jgi:hypothetical protein
MHKRQEDVSVSIQFVLLQLPSLLSKTDLDTVGMTQNKGLKNQD